MADLGTLAAQSINRGCAANRDRRFAHRTEDFVYYARFSEPHQTATLPGLKRRIQCARYGEPAGQKGRRVRCVRSPTARYVMPAAGESVSRPFAVIDGDPAGGVVLVCDHARNTVPAAYGTLGLPSTEFSRHIAFDPGAAAVTADLATRLGAPAVLRQLQPPADRCQPGRRRSDAGDAHLRRHDHSSQRLHRRAGAPGPYRRLSRALPRRRICRRRSSDGSGTSAAHCLDSFVHTGLEGKAAALARRRSV